MDASLNAQALCFPAVGKEHFSSAPSARPRLPLTTSLKTVNSDSFQVCCRTARQRLISPRHCRLVEKLRLWDQPAQAVSTPHRCAGA
eukprot:3776048-Amphidinium_carterae.2